MLKDIDPIQTKKTSKKNDPVIDETQAKATASVDNSEPENTQVPDWLSQSVDTPKDSKDASQKDEPVASGAEEKGVGSPLFETKEPENEKKIDT